MPKSAKRPAKFEKRKLSPKQQQLHNFSFGSQGEQTAVTYLQNQGWQILETNLRYKHQEIDIVALDPIHKEVVFVEVKTRHSDSLGGPASAVNFKKQQAIFRVAQLFLIKNHLDLDFRLDIIAISGPQLKHYQNVSWP